jgi:hypothetical protein
MTTQNTLDSSWTIFIDILSDEFTDKTGFGVYAHITPIDISLAYQEYRLRNSPMRLFVREYVQHYI